jgi:predicted amidohydrolase
MNSKQRPDLRVVMAQQDFLVGDIYTNADRILQACVQARDETLLFFPN